MRNWLKQAEIDSGRQAGASTADAQRIRVSHEDAIILART